MKKILLITAIFFIFFSNSAFAQESSQRSTGQAYSFFIEKIVKPVKHFFSSAETEKIPEASQQFLEESQETIKKKQSEIVNKAQEKAKEEAKKQAQSKARRLVDWLKDLLSPLKTKIQEGRDWLRESKDGSKKIFLCGKISVMSKAKERGVEEGISLMVL